MRCWRRPTVFRYVFQSSVGQSSGRFSNSSTKLPFTPCFLAGGVSLRGGGLPAKPLPFWACLSAVGQGLHDDASDVSSLALPVVTCSARRLVRVKPCRLFLHA